jgi:3-hydroxybutyryl-CoA dehydrogenase
MSRDESILVIGTGQMGPGIALSCALAGYPVSLSGRSHERLAKATRDLEAATAVMVESDLLTASEGHAALERISAEVGYAAATRSTYIVEAIAEDLAVKRDLLAAVERLAPATALLASTSSALSPTALQHGLQHPERLLLTHYIRPAHLMPMCEVVRGEATSEATVQRARALLEACGIRPLLCRDVPGFVFNRLHLALVREALALLRDGVASLADIEDTVKLGFGARFPAMGPFEYIDLSGLDLIATVAAAVYPHLDCARDAANGPLAEHIAQGRLGMKAGHGFHQWPGESPAAFIRRRDQEIIRRRKILRDEQRTRAAEREDQEAQ